jgi:hypothetical protein
MAMFSKVADLFQTVLKFLRFLNVSLENSGMILIVLDLFQKLLGGLKVPRAYVRLLLEFFEASKSTLKWLWVIK